MFQDLDQIRSNFVEKCIKDIFSETFQRFWKKIRYIGRSLSVLGQVSIAFSMTWYEKGPERSPLSNQVPLNFRSPPQQFRAPRSPHSASRYYIWSPKTVLIVRWMRGTFEFDQPYKQAESKMQVTGKISSSK